MVFPEKPKGFDTTIQIVSCFCQYKKTFLLLQRNKQKPQGETWGVPAGKISVGEKQEQSLLREIKEETGISVNVQDLYYFQTVFIRYAEYDFTYHMFFTHFSTQPSVVLNPEEHINFKWVTPEESLRINLIQDEDYCVKMYFKMT